MIRTASTSRQRVFALTLLLIALIALTAVLTSELSRSNSSVNADSIANQIPKQSTNQKSTKDLNETNSPNATNLVNNSTGRPNTVSVSSGALAVPLIYRKKKQ
jgi:hypothetical protein